MYFIKLKKKYNISVYNILNVVNVSFKHLNMKYIIKYYFII